MTDVVLYILMRNDMASMTPGRAVAQGSHCANDCVKILRNGEDYNSKNLELWENQTGNFGTVIVLSASLSQIRDLDNELSKQEVYKLVDYGITHDPTYPVKDGETVHLVPVDTCMWIFGEKTFVKPYVEHLGLY